MHRYLRPDAELDAIVKQVMAEEAAEAKAAFHLRLRAKGVQDLAILRAFELVDRHLFVPHRYVDLAARDIALPIGCGQTMDEPWVIARMVEALRLTRPLRVLEIGTGSGYSTAALAQLAGEVLSLERYQSLAANAEARLKEQGVGNVLVLHADGLDLPSDIAAFDRVLVNGLLREVPDSLLGCLSADGILVCARPAGEAQMITRYTRTADGLLAESICACRMSTIEPGVANAL